MLRVYLYEVINLKVCVVVFGVYFKLGGRVGLGIDFYLYNIFW